MIYGFVFLVAGLLASCSSLNAQSLELNGDLDYATIDDVAGSPDPADNLDIGDNTFTLEMWVRHDGNSDKNARLIDKTNGNATSGGYEVHLINEGEQPQVRFSVPNTFNAFNSNQGIPANRWTHLAFTYDGNQLAIYINGEKDATTSAGGDVNGNDLPFVIGANTGKNDQFFSGQIDDIRVWRDARELIEIRNNLYKGLDGNESGLIAYYPFQSLTNASNTAQDAVGGANLNLQGDFTATANIYPLSPDLYVLNEGNSAVELELKPRIAASEGVAASRYVLYRADALDSNFTALDTINRSNGLLYTDTSASNGLTYLYKAAAIDPALNTTASRSYQVTARPRFAQKTVEAPNGGTSLLLEGGQDHAVIPDNQSPSMDIRDKSFSIEMWVKHSGNSDDNARLIDKTNGNATNGGYEVYLVDDGERPQVTINLPTTFTKLTSNRGIPQGRWTHLAFTYDGSELTIYINGRKDASTSAGGSVNGNGLSFVVGANTGRNDQFYRGRLDELAIWDDARTQNEIQQNYQQPLKGYEEDLKAYWRFNDVVPVPQGQTNRRRSIQLKEDAEVKAGGAFPLPPIMHARVVNDSIKVQLASRYAATMQDTIGIYRRNAANGNASLITKVEGASDTSLQTSLPLSPDPSQPDSSFFLQASSFNSQQQESDLGSPVLLANKTNLGNALVLDGDQDFGVVPDNSSPSMDIRDNAFSLEMWVNHDGASDTNARLIDKTIGSATNGGYELHLVGSSDTPKVKVSLPATFSGVTSQQGLPPDQWSHVAFTYDGNQLTIYIDGQKSGSSNGGQVVEGNSLPFVVGANTARNDQFFSGQIDELRLWDDARSLSEIQASYQEELVGNEQGLKAYWRFNGTPGDTIAYVQRERIKTLSLRGDATFTDGSVFTGVEPTAQKPEDGYRLASNAPNPFRDQTTIRYTLPKRSQVQLTVYNLRGDRITQLVNQTQEAGTYQTHFRPAGLPNGVYLYRLRTGDFHKTRRMLLLR
jgi:hypothetical protein